MCFETNWHLKDRWISIFPKHFYEPTSMVFLIFQEVKVTLRYFLFILAIVIFYKLVDLFVIWENFIIKLEHIRCLVKHWTHRSINCHSNYSMQPNTSAQYDFCMCSCCKKCQIRKLQQRHFARARICKILSESWCLYEINFLIVLPIHALLSDWQE